MDVVKRRLLICILGVSSLLTLAAGQGLHSKNLRERVYEEQKDVLIQHGPGMPLLTGKQDDESERLDALVCNSELVVTGKLLQQTSELSQDEMNVTTKMEFRVQQIFKSTASGETRTSLIDVVRPGGTVKIGEHSVTEGFASFQPLSNGQVYLLLLKKIPGSKSYESVDGFGTLHVRGGRLLKTTQEPGGPDLDQSLPSFYGKLKNSIKRCGER